MKKHNLIFTFILLLLAPMASFAQETSEAAAGQSFLEQYSLEIIVSLAVLVCLIALLALFVAWWGLRVIVKLRLKEQGLEPEPAIIQPAEGEENVGFWARFWNRFNSAVPVAKEASVVTDHEYDGIRELDNRLPPWWLYGFYFTIIFGVLYLIHYHVLGTGMSQEEEYKAAMMEAEQEVEQYLASLDNLVDETNVTVLEDQAELAEGEAIYQANCAVCHLEDGGGSVGPNLTDKYWIHGGDIKSIFRTIKQGVPAKGMISWESQLSPKEMQQVASFIYQMEGTTPETAKEPQGELFEREEGGASDESGDGSTEEGTDPEETEGESSSEDDSMVSSE